MGVQINAVTMGIHLEIPLKLTYGTAIPFMEIYPEDSISYHGDICTSIFTATRFTNETSLAVEPQKNGY